MTTQEYLDSPYRIGFMSAFPLKEKLKSFDVEAYCKQFPVKFQVHIAKFSFGKNNEYEVYGIITDEVNISNKLPLDGFGSMCCYDEAKTMKEAIASLIEELGLSICNDVNSWPFAKIILLNSKETIQKICG